MVLRHLALAAIAVSPSKLEELPLAPKHLMALHPRADSSGLPLRREVAEQADREHERERQERLHFSPSDVSASPDFGTQIDHRPHVGHRFCLWVFDIFSAQSCHARYPLGAAVCFSMSAQSSALLI